MDELSKQIDLIRIRANQSLNPDTKSSLGQFFTPSQICLFMASLFKEIKDDVRLLDPGSGAGSLTGAFCDEAIRRQQLKSLDIVAFDIDKLTEPFFDETIELCRKACRKNKISFKSRLIQEDFVINASRSLNSDLFSDNLGKFSHIIMNPPYKKINTDSEHRKVLQSVGIETVNLYAGFVALAIRLLQPKGELVAIIPRSFCNGPYYQGFRELLLKETFIRNIHIFESRNNAFAEDEVLQENIIIHSQKNGKPSKIKITSSSTADFQFDEKGGSYTTSDLTIRSVNINSLVKENDKQKFLHIAPTQQEQLIVDRLACFSSTLEDIGLEVSTGPVVDFRLRPYLKEVPTKNTVPLIYPVNLNGTVTWPKKSKRPGNILVTKETKPWLWQNSGCFVIIRRFSSKEEPRRIVAAVYNEKLEGELIGFENKLNVFHINKKGFNETLAKGLFVYLNCTLLDKYYRQFGGHTQVNATDLKTIHYPNIQSLNRIGSRVHNFNLNQKEIDNIINSEITIMGTNNTNNPLLAQQKIDEALIILKTLGMPKAQQNERSALTLLALVNLNPEKEWSEIERPMIGVTPIMDWCKNVYAKEYAPNTRETFRRQTLHQFVAGGLVLYNPDQPDRAVNSPKACYQITTEVFDLLISFGTNEWQENLKGFLGSTKTLITKYAKEREMNLIPLAIDDKELKLSSGLHSKLLKDIIKEFGPRFAPGADVLYVGDTNGKDLIFKKEKLLELGITLNKHGKKPDVILFDNNKNWLFLIESVTSHGPVDGKRHEELYSLFKNAAAGLVYVSAFPNKKKMIEYLHVISWETEVWIAESPTHMIHFNGNKFLGPHK